MKKKNYKKIIIISLIILFFWWKTIIFADTDENWNMFQTNITSCNLDDSPNLIKQNAPPYSDYINAQMDQNYQKYLQDLSVNQSINPNDDPLSKAKIIYRETQNLIFNCAILYSKMRIWSKVRADIKESSDSNNSKMLKQQEEDLSNQISQNKCANLNDLQDIITFKIILLDNVTYQNCIYRYYLDYLGNYSKDNIQSVVKYNKWVNLTTETLPDLIKKSSSDVTNEINHSKIVYNQALISYSEFENTYPLHILLSFIYDDYVKIMNNLGKILAPLSQLFYKIPQAQKQ